jgi:hypothetical protein
MTRLRSTITALVLILGVATVIGRPASAQRAARLDVGVAAGPSPYDLSGTGTGFAAAIRGPWEPRSWLVIEPSVGVFSYKSQFNDRLTYLFPELSIQGQLRLGRVRPFLGGGAGGGFALGGRGETVATLHGVGGSRFDVSPEWAISGELRVRAVRPWTGNTVEFLFGVNRRLQ